MKKNKRAFTLIELVAVLVILAIIALIVTPLVLNIIKKSKDSANKRSVDAYGKTVELAVATYLLDNEEYPKCQSDLNIEYSGNEVICNVMNLNENGSIYLSECTVGGKEVKDSSTKDGYYHYGKLTGLKKMYKTYKIGDMVTYNGIYFYVIENSDDSQDSVTLLKEEPLEIGEVYTYGAGHSIGYVNGYGGMAYYSSETCKYGTYTGCMTDYEKSDIKQVVDAWASDKLKASDLKEDNLGYKARLITFDELTTNLGYAKKAAGTTTPSTNGETPEWVYNSKYSYNKYSYWTMSQYYDSSSSVWVVDNNWLTSSSVDSLDEDNVIRPVINLYKTAISNTNLQEISDGTNLKCN